MLTAALQDLFYFLSKMPDLNFSKIYLDEFFNRTNALPGEITLANYQAAYPFLNEKKILFISLHQYIFLSCTLATANSKDGAVVWLY